MENPQLGNWSWPSFREVATRACKTHAVVCSSQHLRSVGRKRAVQALHVLAIIQAALARGHEASGEGAPLEAVRPEVVRHAAGSRGGSTNISF
jgi:hypothetical protein